MIKQAVRFVDDVLLSYGVGRSISMAAYSLFQLNRAASVMYFHQKQVVYRFKNVMLKWLYLHGYCIRVRWETQVLGCWGCDGTGRGEVYWTGSGKDGYPEYEYEDCWKCGGTGIYRENQLYLFTFRVGGTHYSWHQPVNLVDWVNVVDLNDALLDARRFEGLIYHYRHKDLSRDEIRYHAMVLWAFLISRGAWVWPPLELYQDLVGGWQQIRRQWKRRLNPKSTKNKDDIPF